MILNNPPKRVISEDYSWDIIGGHWGVLFQMSVESPRVSLWQSLSKVILKRQVISVAKLVTTTVFTLAVGDLTFNVEYH